MANGPLGGFMPTPPSPGQPPQVKLETSAESRGAFNKFLGTLPSNGAVAPIPTGVVPSSTAPVTPMTDNVNIFQPQMSQMAPMPMMPPAQPVQMMFDGGFVDDTVGDTSAGSFDDYDFGGSTDVSIDSDDISGGTFDDGDSGISFTDDSAGGQDIVTGGQPTETPGVVDTRPRTNIRNVGPTSNLRFDPQFAADIAERGGLDPRVSLRPADFAQTTQGGASVAPANLSTGLKSLANLGAPVQLVDPAEGIAPITRTSNIAGVDRRPDALDLLGLGGLGVDLQSPVSNTFSERLGFERDRIERALGIDKNQNTIDALMSGFDRPKDNRGTQIAGLPTIVPGAGGLPSIDTVADDLVQGAGKLEQRSGANINNPGNIRTGGGFDGEIGVTKDGFAIFDNMKSGVDAIGKLATTYGGKRDINTVREFANRYSPRKENTAKQIAGKINVISNALGVGPDEKVDFTDANVQAKLTPAVITSEIGADKTRDVANVLKGFSPSPLSPNLRDLNPNVTSNVDQLAALDPVARVEPETVASVSPTKENITATSRGDVPIDQFAIQPTFQNFGLPGVNLPNVGSTRSTVQQDQARALSNLVGQRQLTPGELLQQNILADRGRALGPVTFGRDLENFAERVDPAQLSRVGEDFDPALNIVDREIDRAEKNRLRDELLREGEIAQNFRRADYRLPSNISLNSLIAATTPGTRLNEAIKSGNFEFKGNPLAPNPLMSRNLQQQLDATNITENALGGRGTAPTTDLTRGPDVSIVGDDERFAELNLKDIVGDVTQERVADILNRPEAFKSTFKIGDAEFPNLIATLANKAGSFFDRRLFDGIVKKGLDAVVDPDTGRIIGAKDEFGNLIEGRDLDQFRDDDGGDDPITTFLKKTTEDKKEEEKDTTPNVFGGGTRRTLENLPTVVSSPFGSPNLSYNPVGFDTGNLNKLIERITGVPSPRRMQEGGTVAAVDRFLSKVA